MSGTTKKRLCWNCEARVSLEEENCTYCGVYLSPASFPGLQNDEIPEPLYKPGIESSIPKSPYEALYTPQNSSDSSTFVKQDDLGSIVFSVSLLLGGGILLLFGIILFVFSSNNLFTLQWNTTYWFVYLFVSLPMLYYGWQKSRNQT